MCVSERTEMKQVKQHSRKGKKKRQKERGGEGKKRNYQAEIKESPFPCQQKALSESRPTTGPERVAPTAGKIRNSSARRPIELLLLLLVLYTRKTRAWMAKTQVNPRRK